MMKMFSCNTCQTIVERIFNILPPRCVFVCDKYHQFPWLWLIETLSGKTRACPRHLDALAMSVRVWKGYQSAQPVNSDEHLGLLLSTPPTQFTVSTPLHFLLPVSGEEPQGSLCIKKQTFISKMSSWNLLKLSSQILVRQLPARWLLEIHTCAHTHTTTSRAQIDALIGSCCFRNIRFSVLCVWKQPCLISCSTALFYFFLKHWFFSRIGLFMFL